ncbi:MAG: YtxH domain-containing protein [Anaerolineae bacterium]|jgi:gas vesicle protein|nr:YtxH domain-containing protein [Anaerolineae bacterium]
MRRMFGFLIGIFVGGLVGGVLALLLAPESGENLRGQLRDRGQNFLNDVRHSADARRIELRGRLESLRSPRNEF